MARAESASVSAHADSIKGLAQAVARPAYRRLLTAEPFLRRAVPVLIVAFLITPRLRGRRRHPRTAASGDRPSPPTSSISIATLVAERMERIVATESGDTIASRLPRLGPHRMARAPPSRAALVLLTDQSSTIIATLPNVNGFVGPQAQRGNRPRPARPRRRHSAGAFRTLRCSMVRAS